MYKLWNLRGRGLQRLRSLAGSANKNMKASNTDDAGSSTYGSFANLKITAEKTVEERDTVKPDKEINNTKLIRATKSVDLLEGKIQQTVNENEKLNVKDTEDSKLWQGLVSKVSSRKTLCSTLTETLQQIVSQTERDFLTRQLEGSVDESKARSRCLDSRLQCMDQELNLKDDVAENHKQELLERISNLALDNQELVGKVQSVIDEKSYNALSLQGEIAEHVHLVDTFESQVNQIHGILDEKEQLYSCSLEREKTLEEQKLQVEAPLPETECQLIEAKKQYDLMLEGKQIELSNNLRELSLKNDQAINDMCKKYELEKIEITNAEKRKAENLIREMERKYNEKIPETKKDSKSYLMHLKEEHGTVVARIQQDNEYKESTLRSYHKEEWQKIQSQAENELERLSLLQKEHELQIKSLRIQHEEECQRLQEELELQKSKEEKQRALLQLPWKVMGENQKLDQDVNSKKEYSVSLIKRKDPHERKEHELQLASPVKQKKNYVSSIKGRDPYGGKQQEHELQLGSRETKHKNPNTRRSFHSTSKLNSIKRKAKAKKSFEKKVPNKARVKLDSANWPASGRSLKRAIRKAQAWCRANGHFVDLSDYLGQGVEACTTPPNGTFHMIFEYRDRELTIYLDGRTLYIKGWRGIANGMFEIQSKDDKERYIPDPSCKVVKTGVNYNDLCKIGGVKNVRIGPEALMNYFDVLFKCDGTESGAVADAVAGIAVNLAEAIRNEEVLKLVIDAFNKFGPEYCQLGPELAFWVKKYDHYSREIMIAINFLVSGLPVPPIIDLRDKKSVIPLHKLLTIYRVLLRSALNAGRFVQKEKHRAPLFSPATEDEDSVDEEETEEEDCVEEDASAPSK